MVEEITLGSEIHEWISFDAFIKVVYLLMNDQPSDTKSKLDEGRGGNPSEGG